MGRDTFNKKKTLFCNKMNLGMRKKLAKFYVWNVLLFGCKTWAMGRRDRDRTEIFEMWVWKRIEIVTGLWE